MYYHTEDEWEQTMEVIFIEKSGHTPVHRTQGVGGLVLCGQCPHFCLGVFPRYLLPRLSSTLASTRGQYSPGTTGSVLCFSMPPTYPFCLFCHLFLRSPTQPPPYRPPMLPETEPPAPKTGFTLGDRTYTRWHCCMHLVLTGLLDPNLSI